MTPELIAQFIPLGPTVVLVAIVLFSDKERKKLAEIVAEQVGDKRLMREEFAEQRDQWREERAKLYDILERHAALLERKTSLLERVEKILERRR